MPARSLVCGEGGNCKRFSLPLCTGLTSPGTKMNREHLRRPLQLAILLDRPNPLRGHCPPDMTSYQIKHLNSNFRIIIMAWNMSSFHLFRLGVSLVVFLCKSHVLQELCIHLTREIDKQTRIIQVSLNRHYPLIKQVVQSVPP